MSSSIQRLRASLEKLRLPELQARFERATGVASRSPNKTYLINRIIEAIEVASRAELADAAATVAPTSDPHQAVLVDGASNASAELVSTGSRLGEDALSHGLEFEETVTTSSVGAGAQGDDAAPFRSAKPPDDIEDVANDRGLRAGTVERVVLGGADECDVGTEPGPDGVPGAAAPETADAREPESAEADRGRPASTAKLPRGALTGLTVEELQAKYLDVVGRSTASSDRAYLCWKIREAAKGKVPTGPRSCASRRSSRGDDVMVLPLRLPASTVDSMDEAWRACGIRTRTDFLREAIRLRLEGMGAADVALLFTPSLPESSEEVS